MRHTITFLLLFVICGIQAQTISGTVNNDGQPLEFVNVILLSLPDSSIVNVSTTEVDGRYQLKKVKNGNYILQATLLSYKDTYSAPFTIENNSIVKDFELLEDSEVLATVEIKARKKLLEQTADKLIVNIADNITSLNGNLLDVLKKVPGMIIVNGKLSMAGQSNPTILINGKTTQYMDVDALMRDIPGDNIKKIEIINQPGAEYEAAGSGPIINIVLKKNTILGTYGTASIGLGWDSDYEYNAGVRLNHSTGPLRLRGNVSTNQNAWGETLEATRKIPVVRNGETIGHDIYNQVSRTPGYPLSYRIGGGMDYRLSDRHEIGVDGRYSTSKNKKPTSNDTKIQLLESTETVNVSSQNVGERNWNLVSVNPYYTFTIDSMGQKLNIDYNWFKFDKNSERSLQNTISDDDFKLNDNRNLQTGDVRVQAAKIDYTLPYNEQFTFKIGSKYSIAKLDNDLKSYDKINNQWSLNNFSNNYIFEEKIKAAYGKMEWRHKTWSGTIGLRYEHSLSTGYNVTIDSTLTRKISQFFPSASISKKIAGPLGINLAYSKRIERPSYGTLNPFVFYLDPYTSQRGNQELRPEFTDSYKGSVTYDGQPFFSFGYKNTKDIIVEVTNQNDDTGETIKTTVNLDKLKNTNIMLALPLDMVLPVNGYLALIANNNTYDAQYLGSNFNVDYWSYTAYAQASFKIPGEINTEISGWYTNGQRDGLIQTGWMYGVDLGFSKLFLDDKLKLSFGISDLFNRFAYGNIKYQNMDIDFASKWQNRSVALKARYSFGKKYFKDAKKRESSAKKELDRLD